MKSNASQFEINTLGTRRYFKWIVYGLLLINFGFYVRYDWMIAGHTLNSSSTILDWTRAYAVTIDESAWMILLILFELETRFINNSLSPIKALIMRAVRIGCYVSIAHTLYAYAVYVEELSRPQLIEGVSDLCELVGDGASYTYNLIYTTLSTENCAELSGAEDFFYIDPPTFSIVQDASGLAIERELAWIDLAEAITWLLILFSIELVVLLQDHKVFDGILFRTINGSKFILYSLLWCAIGYWIFRGHYMFAWDELVWIVGFIVIEVNMIERHKNMFSTRTI